MHEIVKARLDEATGVLRLWRKGVRRPKRAVSLIEVLVVFAILALLLAMLLPSLAGAREQVRRVFCANNLKQWGEALDAYLQDFDDFLPEEGNYWNVKSGGTWFNALPPYLGAPSYRDIERVNKQIKERPPIDVWICPSKNRTAAFKSESGYNQFHYGMNQVLDGLGSVDDPSADTPDFPDTADPIQASRFINEPDTVFMFDICWNSMAGTPRDVATRFQRHFVSDRPVAEFHGDYANMLYLNGAVTHAGTDDLVSDRDFRHGDIRWHHPRLYWGYRPTAKTSGH